MAKFLLAAGADQEHKTDEMHTALMEASMDGHVDVARLLLDSGAQVCITNPVVCSSNTPPPPPPPPRQLLVLNEMRRFKSDLCYTLTIVMLLITQICFGGSFLVVKMCFVRNSLFM